uniref:protein-tyrosine-phosphatase n=1 Tax=Ditylenchus dipsaci TaxID=166011 RepID=A0A915D6A0_9BILA
MLNTFVEKLFFGLNKKRDYYLPIEPGEMPNRSPYFYNITGERARELLFLYGSKGQFLVRPSESNPTDHTLSVHRGTRVTHVKIPSINGFHKLPTGEEFSAYFPRGHSPSENVINVGYDRFFHINISGSEAEELLKDEPNGTYLVRESTSNPGEYALSVKNDDAILHIRIYHSDAKFRVVPKDNFRSIADLLDNYIRLPMVQNGGNAVRLKMPLQSTRFTAAAIDDRIDCLMKSARKPNAKDGFVEEFEKLHREKDTCLFISCKEGRKPENVRKNRYRNVVPYDHTRIKLTLRAEESQNDYINANLIEILSDNPKYAEFAGYEKRRYISTQGCLQETVGDFWHMMWQENSTIIVMITKEVERGRVKCFRYWPDLNKEQVFSFYDEEFVVTTEQEKETEDFTLRTFSLMNKEKGTETRRIHHFQFLGWEDNGCPSDSILHFLDEVNSCVETSHKTKPTVSSPIVVHCSAGIGRTGTFIVLDMLINRIKKIGPSTPLDITKTVRMLREQRATMVQTEAQYRFIYLAISAFMKLRRAQIQNESDPSSALPSPSPLTRNPAPCFHNLTINGANNVFNKYSLLKILPSPPHQWVIKVLDDGKAGRPPYRYLDVRR